jgi:hypothetical protein
MKISVFILLHISCIFSLVIATPIEQFHSQCHVSGVASPQHILPKPVSNEVSSRSLKNISEYFNIGQLKCIELLKRSPSLPQELGSIQRILDHYGLLLVEFGPISDCPTFSTCWFGMLSCGRMKEEAFLQEYDHDLKQIPSRGNFEESPFLPYRGVPNFRGWSMQALNIQFRVVGPEILFPEVVYDPTNNILLCSYTLTIPGSYRIEIIPREFYPGILFNYTKKEKQEGYDLIGDKSPKHVLTSHPMKSSPRFCDPKTRQRRKTDPPTLPHKLPLPLPYCSKGNHRGRYLTIPRESLKICEALPLMTRYWKEFEQPPPILESEYIATDHVEHDRQLREFFIQQYRNQSQSIEQRLLYQELLRHTDEKSSLCPLIVVNELSYVKDSHHEIFAPSYECRYKFYSPLQVRFILVLSFPSSLIPNSLTLLRRKVV